MKNAILFTALTALVAVEAHPYKHRHAKHGGCKAVTQTVTVTVPAGGDAQPAPTDASAVSSVVPSSAAAESSAANSAEPAPSAASSAEASSSAVNSAEPSPSAASSAEPSPSAANSAEPSPSAAEAPVKENAAKQHNGGHYMPNKGWTSTWATSLALTPRLQEQAPAPAQSHDAQSSAAPAEASAAPAPSADAQVENANPSTSSEYKPPAPTSSGEEFMSTHTDTSNGGDYSEAEKNEASKRESGDPVPTYDIGLRIDQEPTDEDYKGTSALSQSILKFHNDLRANFGAEPLAWNEQYARRARSDWNDCLWEHKGEDNLHTFSASYESASEAGGQACKAWADEWKEYPFDNPAAQAYSHFTQMVWKEATEVGCGWTYTCPAEGGMARKLNFRCVYSPGGNTVSKEKPGVYFEENVGRCTVCNQ
ncbi:hypothetical protein A1Q2_02179 [Trichosporon asahii var. asahii CBS 8904]|uniref:SCP domain-containing protein n=1 Tax=Trichosporon asahii var. asahii (strain CBS 8904) TaxID=1220162 RepID=K1VSQ0_TRIAC|nr:hypothetical protein A1Q2_02179 [Trichosporon asahii var. asahii CBS 8904]